MYTFHTNSLEDDDDDGGMVYTEPRRDIVPWKHPRSFERIGSKFYMGRCLRRHAHSESLHSYGILTFMLHVQKGGVPPFTPRNPFGAALREGLLLR